MGFRGSEVQILSPRPKNQALIGSLHNQPLKNCPSPHPSAAFGSGTTVGAVGCAATYLPMRLKGKKAVITGASWGIGAAIARRFAAEGCALFLAGGRNAEGLRATAEACRQAGAEVTSECLSQIPASGAAAAFIECKRLPTFDTRSGDKCRCSNQALRSMRGGA
ncbi:MAG: SDR family NAD(P)-dependent oxidoreductase [Nitrospinota bacterium]